MGEEKICPMLSKWISKEPQEISCYTKECAWYDKLNRQCALMTLAKAVDRLPGKLTRR